MKGSRVTAQRVWLLLGYTVADYEEFDSEDAAPERPPDPRQISIRETLIQFFEEHREQVFFSRQLEVRYERDYFHWITNRALRDLEAMGTCAERVANAA